MKHKIKISFKIFLLIYVIFFIIGCNKNKLEVGDSYGGGIIAYILHKGDPGYDKNIQHGIIVAPEDQSNNVPWNIGSFVSTYARGTEVGMGKINTDIIVSKLGAGFYAASVCADLDFGGYSDWYLPSRDELLHVYEAQLFTGLSASYSYWCSTELTSDAANYMAYGIGTMSNSYKNVDLAVRAIRSF